MLVNIPMTVTNLEGQLPIKVTWISRKYIGYTVLYDDGEDCMTAYCQPGTERHGEILSKIPPEMFNSTIQTN